MNSDQIKDPLCYLCLAGTVVTTVALTQEVTGSNTLFTIILPLNSMKCYGDSNRKWKKVNKCAKC